MVTEKPAPGVVVVEPRRQDNSVSKVGALHGLGSPVVHFYFFFGGGFPYKKTTKKGTLILTSLLEDLVVVGLIGVFFVLVDIRTYFWLGRYGCCFGFSVNERNPAPKLVGGLAQYPSARAYSALLPSKNRLGGRFHPS